MRCLICRAIVGQLSDMADRKRFDIAVLQQQQTVLVVGVKEALHVFSTQKVLKKQ